jgi:hypothetical protein
MTLRSFQAKEVSQLKFINITIFYSDNGRAQFVFAPVSVSRGVTAVIPVSGMTKCDIGNNVLYFKMVKKILYYKFAVGIRIAK